MSIALMSKVWELQLPDSDKLVLLALADNANDEGACWPSVATLARKCSKDERTIQRVIARLIEAGHLTKTTRTGTSNVWHVHPRHDATPGTMPPRQHVHPPSGMVPPKPSMNRHTSEAKASSVARASLVPADFLPVVKPDSITGKAMANWPPGEIEEQVEHFIDRHTATGTLSKDWQASWRTWVKNWRKFNGHQRLPNRSDGPRTALAAADAVSALERIFSSP